MLFCVFLMNIIIFYNLYFKILFFRVKDRFESKEKKKHLSEILFFSSFFHAVTDGFCTHMYTLYKKLSKLYNQRNLFFIHLEMYIDATSYGVVELYSLQRFLIQLRRGYCSSASPLRGTQQ